VVKLYPENGHIAAKRLRLYVGSDAKIPKQLTYRAIEKLSDIGEAIPPALTPQDTHDLRELEEVADPSAGPNVAQGALPQTAPFDPELDAAASPAAEGEAPEPEEDDDDRMGVSVEETHSFDVHRSWLSAGLGYYQNVGPLVDGARGSGYFAGAGVRYGYSLGKEIFLRTSRLQDSLVAELGVSIYKIVNFETNQNDSYSVLPLTLTARYNILFSENFGIFFYTGVCQNVVFGATNTTGDTLAQLRSLLPAAGGGLFFRIGPSWHVRVDAGYDMIGAGLSLRF
jgi:hypothetical protein